MNDRYEYTPEDVPHSATMQDYGIQTLTYENGYRWIYIGANGTIWNRSVDDYKDDCKRVRR